jgi:hypothetical protein
MTITSFAEGRRDVGEARDSQSGVDKSAARSGENSSLRPSRWGIAFPDYGSADRHQDDVSTVPTRSRLQASGVRT